MKGNFGEIESKITLPNAGNSVGNNNGRCVKGKAVITNIKTIYFYISRDELYKITRNIDRMIAKVGNRMYGSIIISITDNLVEIKYKWDVLTDNWECDHYEMIYIGTISPPHTRIFPQKMYI